MSEKREFLLVYVKGARPGPLLEGVRAGLQKRGAEIREIILGDDYRALLDGIADGAVPVVIRKSL